MGTFSGAKMIVRFGYFLPKTVISYTALVIFRLF